MLTFENNINKLRECFLSWLPLREDLLKIFKNQDFVKTLNNYIFNQFKVIKSWSQDSYTEIYFLLYLLSLLLWESNNFFSNKDIYDMSNYDTFFNHSRYNR